MSLPKLSINRPVMAWMMMLALIVFGFLSFKDLGVSQLPDVDFPVVSVNLSLNGAAPEVMESQVIDPLEDAIMQIEGVRSVTSNAQQSSGSISIEFELDRKIDKAVQDVEVRISQAQNLLPVDLNPPVVRKTNPEDQPILWLALTAPENEKKSILMMYAHDTLMQKFTTIPGVGDVALGGYTDPALRIWLDNKKLFQNEMTADDIINSITKEHIEVPLGQLNNDKKEFNLRLMGEAKTPEDFGKIRINSRIGLGVNFRPTQLSSVARIEESTMDVRKIARFNGKNAIGLGILKQHGANAVEVAKLIREKVKEVIPELPPGYSISIRSDTTKFIRASVTELIFTLCLSALLTSLVCLLFLGSWSSTFNVLLAIPTSIIGTFTIIKFFGFTVNTFTLLGLSLAIGIVVDDAIMMLENMIRHSEMGKSPKLAGLIGAEEITFSALAATIAVVAIFLPVIFIKGVIGKYFFQYGITVSTAVLLSLFEALTLTPMRYARYFHLNDKPSKWSEKTNHFFENLSLKYKKLLQFLLGHRIKTLVIATLLAVSSFFLAKTLPSEMLPAQDQSQLLIRFKAPVGTALNVTDEKLRQAEKIILDHKEVDGAFTLVGGFGGDAVNQGNLVVALVDKNQRKLSQQELMKVFRAELKVIKGVQVNIQDTSLRGFSSSRGFPIEFILQGPDWQKLTQLSDQLIEQAKNENIAADMNTDVQPGMPELQIIPNKEKAAVHGVSLKSITSVVNTLVGGAVLNGKTQYEKNEHRYPIEVRLESDQRNTAESLNHIRVRNNRGQTVQLSEVVDLKTNASPSLISRVDRERALKVYANPGLGLSQQQSLTKLQDLAQKILPGGYSMKLTGSAQSFKESMQSLMFALAFGILVSYMVLASQFNSFLHPLTVLLALPFSFSGAFLGLKIFGQSINIYSLIGFILLMGIVKKNSILLVDFTNQCRKNDKLETDEALLKACPVRLRPILMTSAATIAGAVPAALALGPGSETTVPMAAGIVGGVFVSTLLTLFIVPCFYSLVSRFEGQRYDIEV